MPTLLLYFVIGAAEVRFSIMLLVALAYNGLLDGSEHGQTVGKRLLKIRTIDAGTGGMLGVTRGLGRAGISALLQFISGFSLLLTLPSLLDVLWPLWDPQRQTWHDKAAGSVVVRVDEPPDEQVD